MSFDFAEDGITMIGKQQRSVGGKSIDEKRKEAASKFNTAQKTAWQQRRKLERILRWLVIGLLGPAALVVSVISAIHLVKWFSIGDNSTFAGWTAGTFEFLAIASMFTIIELSRLSKFVVFLIWLIIIALVCLQVNGNAFYVFDYMQTHRDLAERAARFYSAQPGPAFERTISFAIGAPLPIISMFVIKILSSYWMLAFNRIKVKRSSVK